MGNDDFIEESKEKKKKTKQKSNPLENEIK